MRLFKHLNKNRNYAIDPKKNRNKAKNILSRHIEEVKKLLSIHEVKTLRKLCEILSSIYMVDKIRFIDDGDTYITSKKYIKGSDFYMNGDMEFFLTEKSLEDIESFINRGKFFTEVVDVLSTTMSHVKKITSIKDEFNFVGYNPLKKHIIDNIEDYKEVIISEKDEEGFSTMKSICYDLIGKLPVYDKIKDL